MDVQEEMSAETREHQGKDTRLKEATISEEREDIWENLRENHHTGNPEVNSWVFCWVVENQELNIVEGSAPSEMEKEIAHRGVGAANVEALATVGSFTPTIGKEKEEEDGDTAGQIGTLRRER
jgi:hypothetical protein